MIWYLPSHSSPKLMKGGAGWIPCLHVVTVLFLALYSPAFLHGSHGGLS